MSFKIEAFKTVFTRLGNAVDSAEEAHERAWLNLIDYKGADSLEVIALEFELESSFASLEASKKAFEKTYNSLRK